MTGRCPSCPRWRRSRRQLEPELVGRRIDALEVLDERWTRPAPPAESSAARRGPRDRAARPARQVPAARPRGRPDAGHAPADDRQPAARSSGRGDVGPARRASGSTSASARPRSRHLRARFELDDGRELWFTDPRRFGQAVAARRRRARCRTSPRGSGSSRSRDELTPELLGRVAAGRTAPLKSFLLDQSGIAGIGNIYADEALFRAGSTRSRPAGSMQPEHCEALREGIVDGARGGARRTAAPRSTTTATRAASRARCRTSSWSTPARASRARAAASAIKRIVVGGRSTYFCPGCQVRLRRRRRAAAGERGDERARAVPCPGFAVGHWTAAEARTGCTVILPPPGTRAASASAAAGRAPARPTSSTRSRTRTRRRRSCSPAAAPSASPPPTASSLARGARAAATRPRPAWCRSCPPRSSTTSTPSPADAAGPARRPRPATRPARPPRPGVPSAAASAPGAARPSRKMLGRERATPGGVGYAATITGAGETVAALAVVNATGDVIGEDGSVLAGPRGATARCCAAPR